MHSALRLQRVRALRQALQHCDGVAGVHGVSARAAPAVAERQLPRLVGQLEAHVQLAWIAVSLPCGTVWVVVISVLLRSEVWKSRCSSTGLAWQSHIASSVDARIAAQSPTVTVRPARRGRPRPAGQDRQRALLTPGASSTSRQRSPGLARRRQRRLQAAPAGRRGAAPRRRFARRPVGSTAPETSAPDPAGSSR